MHRREARRQGGREVRRQGSKEARIEGGEQDSTVPAGLALSRQAVPQASSDAAKGEKQMPRRAIDRRSLGMTSAGVPC